MIKFIKNLFKPKICYLCEFNKAKIGGFCYNCIVKTQCCKCKHTTINNHNKLIVHLMHAQLMENRGYILQYEYLCDKCFNQLTNIEKYYRIYTISKQF